MPILFRKMTPHITLYRDAILFFVEVSFRVWCGAPQVRSLRKFWVNLYRWTPLGPHPGIRYRFLRPPEGTRWSMTVLTWFWRYGLVLILGFVPIFLICLLVPYIYKSKHSGMFGKKVNFNSWRRWNETAGELLLSFGNEKKSSDSIISTTNTQQGVLIVEFAVGCWL